MCAETSSNINKQDIERRNRKRFEKYHNEAEKRIKLNQQSLDKMILSVSVAFLGILQFLLENLYGITCTITMFLILNALTIISVATSLYTGKQSNIESIKYAKKYYLEDKEEYFNKQDCWTKTTDYLNNLSLFLFTLSIIMLSVMSWTYLYTKGQ